jgi:iron-sulfur cluster assembly protein
MDIAFPLTITTEAVLAIKQIIEAKDIGQQYALRLGLKGAGCGASYLIGFDTPSPTDLHFEQAGIAIVIDKKHLMYLAGVELDYEVGEQGRGFTFSGQEPA